MFSRHQGRYAGYRLRMAFVGLLLLFMITPTMSQAQDIAQQRRALEQQLRALEQQRRQIEQQLRALEQQQRVLNQQQRALNQQQREVRQTRDSSLEWRNFNRSEHSIRSSWSDGRREIEVWAGGEVVLNDEGTDVVRLDPDGYLMIEEANVMTRRRIEIEPGADGVLVYTYRERGDERPFDRMAQTWFAAILEDVVAMTGIGAEARVERLLREDGVEGVLEDISRLRSDSIKRRYFEILTAQPDLNGEDRRRIIRQVPLEITSDSHKAELLIVLTDRGFGEPGLQGDLFELYHAISSDSHRHHILGHLWENTQFDKAGILRHAAATLSSDSHKSEFLTAVLQTDMSDPNVRAASLELYDAISSDSHRHQVLMGLWENPRSDRVEVLRRASHTLSSDSHKAEFLRMVSQSDLSDPRVRAAALELYDAISSDSHRHEILRQFWDNPQFDRAEVLRRAAETLSSDSHKSEFLRELGDMAIGNPAVEPSFFELYDTISSDSHKREILRIWWDSGTFDRLGLLERTMHQISSDSHKAELLRSFAPECLNDDRLRPMFLDAVRTISSDSHRRELVRRIGDHESVSKQDLLDLMK